MSLRQTFITVFSSLSRRGKTNPRTKTERSAGLSDGMLNHIVRDTKDHRLTSLLSRQIVDAQFRLAALECQEERYAQIRLIDDLMRRRAREIRSPLQYG